MHSTRSSMKAGLNGAVLGAAAAVLLGLMLTMTAMLTGGHVSLPGLIEATGGTTNGAASVEFTLGWTALAAAAVIGASFEARRTRSRTHGA